MMARRSCHLTFADRFESSRDVAWHTHDVPELVLVTAGTCSCTVGGRSLPGAPGTLWIMPGRVRQYQHDYELVRTTYIGFRNPPAWFDPRPRAMEVGTEGYVRRWMEDMVDLHRRGRSDSVVDALLAALLSEVAHARTRQVRVARLHPAVRDAVAYIESHLTDPLEIDTLAGEVHLSPSHLSALFRKSMGVPPLRYQQRLRLRQAERLLHSPYSTVKQVAAACGYDDPNYFVRLFRQRYGRPPRQWRGG